MHGASDPGDDANRTALDRGMNLRLQRESDDAEW
jgi:hypothetical protein